MAEKQSQAARRLIRRAALALSLIPALAANGNEPKVESPAPGRVIYTNYCARCHGVNMVNTGAAFDLRRFPADQQERFERSVKQGLRAMPAWGAILKPIEVQALWDHVVEGR